MEYIILTLLGILAGGNAVKALERLRSTYQITMMYHSARANNPESLGSNPDEVEKKIDEALQKTIASGMLHAISTGVCLMLGWSLVKGLVPNLGPLGFLLWVLALLSIIWSGNALKCLVVEWMDAVKSTREMEELAKSFKSQLTVPKLTISDQAIILISIVGYGLTSLAAAYFIFLLYQT